MWSTTRSIRLRSVHFPLHCDHHARRKIGANPTNDIKFYRPPRVLGVGSLLCLLFCLPYKGHNAAAREACVPALWLQHLSIALSCAYAVSCVSTFHTRHALAAPPGLPLFAAARRRQRGHVPTAVAAGAPGASSSRHVDSHAPRCNDENLLLKATTRRTSEATDPDCASEETLLAVWVCHMDCNKWHIDHYIPTRQNSTRLRVLPCKLSLLYCAPPAVPKRRCRHRHRGRCRRRRRRRRRPRRPLLYRSRRTHPGTNFHRMKGRPPQ